MKRQNCGVLGLFPIFGRRRNCPGNETLVEETLREKDWLGMNDLGGGYVFCDETSF